MKTLKQLQSDQQNWKLLFNWISKKYSYSNKNRRIKNYRYLTWLSENLANLNSFY